MKQIWRVVVLSLLVVLSAMPAIAAEMKAQDKPSRVEIQATSITATVEKIDYKTRTVVLKGPKGGLVELQVGEEAKNFNQVKKGDKVTIDYLESVAIDVQKSKGEPLAAESTSITRAKPGEKPGGTMKTTGMMTAKVEEINYKTREVSLKMAEGNIMKITVGPQVKRLEEVRKGDEVVVQYTSTVTISVAKP
jgi:ribosomal 50S subunit-recycling heat shock protein